MVSVERCAWLAPILADFPPIGYVGIHLTFGEQTSKAFPMPVAPSFFFPWEFSPTILLACVSALGFYLRGLHVRQRVGIRDGMLRPLAFVLGVVLIYVVMQTHYDYLSQHMFFVHRAQHLVLHHLGPFLIMIAAPQPVLASALPTGMYTNLLLPAWRYPLTQRLYRVIQNPVLASLLFVGLIYFWLTPSIHFDAMLSADLYKAMNWSMVLDGLLFWYLILDPRTQQQGALLGYGTRIIVLWAIILPQIALGAYIGLSRSVLFDVYDVCGRAWPLSPITDQQIGGLITWIPSSMMSAVAMLVVLRFWLRSEHPRTKSPSAEEAVAQ
jgi:putative membrane protein